MLTNSENVIVTTDLDTRSIPIRDDTSRHLMKNRLRSLLNEYPARVVADKTLGQELLDQAKDYFAKYVTMQDVNRITESEVAYALKKLKQNEYFYESLFGKLPDSYREVVLLP